MAFNSSVFAIFLILVFAIYWLLNKNLRIQNLFIVVASYFFYGWWDWRFLGLLLVSSIVDFISAYFMAQTNVQRKKKLLLGISLFTNLGILGTFKYYDFFATSFVALFQKFGIDLNIHTLNVLLPVGVSFYTFQTLSYTIEVYRKNLEPSKDLIAFMAFVSFFPQLVAGPIERAKRLLPQFYKKRIFSYEQSVAGLRLMLWGFFKKIVIADNIARSVDMVFNHPADFHGITVVLATIGFAIQIYCDFSGYSDIAIGCAKLFGIEIMKNFDAPYFSKSPKEFWRKWHISLSTWFRDYVYIPLGGNRKGLSKMQWNLMITFLISGLWHGANWTFVIWGFLHGSAVCIQNYIEHKKINFRINTYLSGLLLFSFVCFAWIFFRAANLQAAILLLSNIFHPAGASEINIFLGSQIYLSRFAASLCLFVLLEILIRNINMQNWFNRIQRKWRRAFYYAIVFWIVYFGAFDNTPHFMYFQF